MSFEPFLKRKFISVFLFAQILFFFPFPYAMARIPIADLPHRPGQSEKIILKLTAVGDIIMHLPVKESAVFLGGYEELFRNVKPYIADSDLALANLETPLVPGHKAVLDWPGYFFAEDAFAITLKRIGFTIINIANNHILDFGNEGFHNTIDALEKRNSLIVLGIQDNPKKFPGKIIQIKGVKIGLIGFTTLLNLPHPIPQKYPRLNYVQNQEEQDLFIESLVNLKKACDLVVVSIHWGDEYSKTVNPYVLFLAKNLLDKGADIILGHHTHILQNVLALGQKNANAQRTEKLVLLSMGNFISNQGRKEHIDHEASLRESAIFRIRIEMEKYKGKNGKILWKKNFNWYYIPIWTKNIRGDRSGEQIWEFSKEQHLITPVILQCEYESLATKMRSGTTLSREEAFDELYRLNSLKKRLLSINKVLGRKNFEQVKCP